MDEILTSIRRMIHEEHPVVNIHQTGGTHTEGDDVLLLDESMISGEDNADHAAPSAAPRHAQIDPNLVAPAAAAAAAASVGELMRQLGQDRTAQVSRHGPTLEDLVREQIRPVMKEWLDAHLPSLVERLVRVEIERVISRASVG